MFMVNKALLQHALRYALRYALWPGVWQDPVKGVCLVGLSEVNPGGEEEVNPHHACISHHVCTPPLQRTPMS